MAVTAESAAQLASGYRGKTYDQEKVRLIHFEFTQGAAAGDATSTMDLADLPFGNVRVLPHMSKLWTSAFGASRVLKVGHREYTSDNGEAIAEDDDAFGSALDVSSATTDLQVGTARKFDMYSRGKKRIFATCTGGTIPAGATVSGYIAIQTF
jgi:hypothetical protein